jgi:poly-gamma-glutamate synthesis protein (capsule biosynthesis protein)
VGGARPPPLKTAFGAEPAQIRFTHRQIDEGVDVVHGHSSHHPRPIEVYRGKLILYGCGDTIDG